MRRTTLGPISSGDLNRSLDDSISGLGHSRRSMGASGLFGGTKAPAFPGSSRKPGPQSRLSFAAAGGDRWEPVGGKASGVLWNYLRCSPGLGGIQARKHARCRGWSPRWRPGG